MIKFRTISELLRIYILPEIEKRIRDGVIKESALPFELYQFRAILRRLADGKVEPIVELNQEVNLVAEVKLRRPVDAGENLTLKDIYHEECFIEPPVYDGRTTAYFVCQCLFIDYLLFFDCRPNLPGITEDELKEVLVPYPILELMNTKKFCEVVKPIEKLKILSKNNWPPAPGYYPKALLYMHKNPTKICDQEFLDIVANSYNSDYWNTRITFWEETNFFPKRLQYVRKAVDAHFQKDFACSVYVIVPQFEGIIRDYLIECKKTPPGKFVDCVTELKKLILSRKVIMFPREVLEAIFEYLERGSFWKHTGVISDPSETVNRHGIAHGIFTGFECEGISLKYLILLDSLFFILLHDRMLVGAL
jgi:hypothetical protein